MSTRFRLLTLVLVLGSACAGCAVGQSPSSSPTAEATASTAEDWGPLAVWDDPGTGDSDLALLSGVLTIEADCVIVGGSVPVWPATFVRWVADEQLIEFLDPLTQRVVRIGDGDRVELGGGEPAADLPWIAQPHPQCPASLFGVGTVGSVNGLGP